MTIFASLAACSSAQAPRYHTLQAPAGAAAAMAASSRFEPAWELLPVGMPAQVEQPQFAVRAEDGTMALLEAERWIAPLAEEMRAALTARLVPALGGDGRRGPGVAGHGWRIRVEVQRFDTMPGRGIRLAAHWALLPADEAKRPLRCETTIARDAGAAYPALSAAHRDAAAQLGDLIAATLRRAEAEAQPRCP